MNDLVSSLNNNEEAAYQELFLRYYERLCLIARPRVGRNDIAQDTVSEVFLNLRAVQKDFKEEKDILHYLIKAVCNRCNTYNRAEAIHGRINGDIARMQFYQEDSIPSPEEEMIEKEMHANIVKAIEGLPPQQRLVMTMRVVDQLTPKEIAGRLDLNVFTVYTHLKEAEKKIRDCFPRIYKRGNT